MKEKCVEVGYYLTEITSDEIEKKFKMLKILM